MTKREIEAILQGSADENRRLAETLCLCGSVYDFADLVEEKNGRSIWTKAFQAALDTFEWVEVPAREEPYLIDDTLIVGSNRHIEAVGATVCLCEGTRVLLLRNKSTLDGSDAPFSMDGADENISIHGGCWMEENDRRRGYGDTGMYDLERSFYGVSTCLFFNHITHLTLSDMTFRHTAGFAVQIGDAADVVCEDIRFSECFADGLHFTGNCTRLTVRRISGQVGDDLVALNVYDWKNSSVDFGPASCILCEDLELSEDSRYKAFRMAPGIYTYADGSTVDCALRDLIVRRAKDITTYKLYCQTPPYAIGGTPEPSGTGSADNLYFEDIDVALDGPIDRFNEYMTGDPVKGSFAAFEIGANIGTMTLENIRLTVDKERFPMGFLLCAGPKSIRAADLEFFDPYLSCTLGQLVLDGVLCNGCRDFVAEEFVHAIVFDDLYRDGASSGRGIIKTVTVR